LSQTLHPVRARAVAKDHAVAVTVYVVDEAVVLIAGAEDCVEAVAVLLLALVLLLDLSLPQNLQLGVRLLPRKSPRMCPRRTDSLLRPPTLMSRM
jgi:hypothetical protein